MKANLLMLLAVSVAIVGFIAVLFFLVSPLATEPLSVESHGFPISVWLALSLALGLALLALGAALAHLSAVSNDSFGVISVVFPSRDHVDIHGRCSENAESLMLTHVIDFVGFPKSVRSTFDGSAPKAISRKKRGESHKPEFLRLETCWLQRRVKDKTISVVEKRPH